MSEFKEVMKERKRMCDSFGIGCEGCPISSESQFCKSFMFENPQEAEESIMKWAKEHPIKTNEDKFKEVFGFDIKDSTTNKCILAPCPKSYISCNKCEYYGFWNKEYKEKE